MELYETLMDTYGEASDISHGPLAGAKASLTWTTIVGYFYEYCPLFAYLPSKKCVHRRSNGIELHETLIDTHGKSSDISHGPLSEATASLTWTTIVGYFHEFCLLLAYLLSKKCVYCRSNGMELHETLIVTYGKSSGISPGLLVGSYSLSYLDYHHSILL